MKHVIFIGDDIQGIYDTQLESAIAQAENSVTGNVREFEDLEFNEFQRKWRDSELKATDHIIPLTDHPDHAATLAYRVALRDWPSTSDFPDTKPTL